MPEVKIKRTEILVVDKVSPHIFGGVTEGIDVYCKDGSKHKVSDKHKSLWPVFQPGLAVEVGYGEFNNREYIHTARAVKDGIGPPVPVAPVNATPQPPQTATAPKEHLSQAVKTLNATTREDSIEAQVAVKEIMESWRVGKLKDGDYAVINARIWCDNAIAKMI